MALAKKKIVVIGAGVAGLYVAQKLAKRSDAAVTLVNDTDHFTFLPRLTELFSHSIDSQKITKQLSSVWKEELILDKANLVNTAEKIIVLESGKTIPYDFVVVTLGSTPNFFNTPGSQYSFPFYSQDDATKLQEHVQRLLEADEQKGTHTFAVVGGGPTGVEVSYALNKLVKAKRPGAKIMLIEAGPGILRVMPDKLRDAAKKVLDDNQIEIHVDTGVTDITPLTVTVNRKEGKEIIPCYTTIWAAGSKPRSIAVTGVELTQRGELPTTPFLHLDKDTTIFSLGDCAATNTPKTAQAAVQQAQVAAQNISNILDGKELVPFTFHDKGTIIAMEKETVGLFFGKVVKGFIAQQLRDKYYQFTLRNYV